MCASETTENGGILQKRYIPSGLISLCSNRENNDKPESGEVAYSDKPKKNVPDRIKERSSFEASQAIFQESCDKQRMDPRLNHEL